MNTEILDSGSIRIAKAILEDAIEVYTTWNGQIGKRKLFLETEAWLWSENDEWIFSYINICWLFNLDPQAVRWMARQKRKAMMRDWSQPEKYSCWR